MNYCTLLIESGKIISASNHFSQCFAIDCNSKVLQNFELRAQSIESSIQSIGINWFETTNHLQIAQKLLNCISDIHWHSINLLANGQASSFFAILQACSKACKFLMRGKRSKRWRSWNWQRKTEGIYCVAQNMNSANSIHSQKKVSQFENAHIEFSNLEILATFLFCWVTRWHPTSAATSLDDVIAVG